MKRILLLLFLGIGELVVLTTVTIYLFFAGEIKGKESIMNRKNTGIILLDRKNRPYFTFFQAKQIDYIPLNMVPGYLQQAIISSEDKDFYYHPGFSPKGIARAILVDLQKKDTVYGGSTITQQLVKNSLLSPRKSFLRKYEEVILALELERRFSKQEILEMYLNSVYFGEGSFGIESATQTYFGKHAKDVTLGESAMLVGLLPSPSVFSPLSHDQSNAKKHQQIVLDEMARDGYISEKTADRVTHQQIVFHPKGNDTNTTAIHFAIMVKNILTKWYGEEFITRSGFQVKTSIDLDYQKFAEQAVKDQVKYLQYDNVSNGAAVALNPKTGEILAMVGSTDWYNNEFGKMNMAITTRQPGSSFKPIVYATAFERRIITPATILHDSPTEFEGGYNPLDYDRKFRGPVLVRRALANSLNVPAVEVMQKLGVPAILESAKRFGITTLGDDPSNYGLSLVLGSGEVSLLELTNAYAAFANQGEQYEPTSILEIKNKYGKPIYTYHPAATSIINPNVAFLITSILSDNNARAEEFGNALTISRPAAVKTGTSEDFRNALTFGFTPSITVGVWVGNNDNSPMDNIAGSLGAAPIWKQMIETYLMGKQVEIFQQPQGVVAANICRDRGLLVTSATSSAIKEYFLAGTEPTENCYGSYMGDSTNYIH